MNKSDLIEAMADSADISKAAAGRALDGLIDAITQSVKNNDAVSIVGFGTFLLRERAARTRPAMRRRLPYRSGRRS